LIDSVDEFLLNVIQHFSTELLPISFVE